MSFGNIYKITNLINNKIYIGQTINPISQRWSAHKSHAKNGSTHKLGRAIRKYGEENFKIELISQYPMEELDEQERYWINQYKSFKDEYGYNTQLGGKDITGYYIVENEKEIIDYYQNYSHNQLETAKHFNLTEYKLRQILTINHIPTDYTNYGNSSRKRVYIYELDKYFDSVIECGTFLFNNGYGKCNKVDSVIARLNHNLVDVQPTYGLSIYYADMTYENFFEKYLNHIRTKTNKNIIYKLDNEKNIIKRFASMGDADSDAGIKIEYYVHGKGKKEDGHYYNGFYWYTEKDYITKYKDNID